MLNTEGFTVFNSINDTEWRLVIQVIKTDYLFIVQNGTIQLTLGHLLVEMVFKAVKEQLAQLSYS